ncbi:MAG: RDD family protein [Acidobacteria bacterium]|nr:RDD family protein [Acidobacteriota bacterium]MCA1641842.1 RDD family protein [Acidobacteriota bacterium]
MFQQFQTPNYASFWLRFAAALIDGLLMMAVFCPIGFALGTLGAVTGGGGGEAAQAAFAGIQLIFQIFSFVLGWLYEALLESSSWQGTVGKKLLGIRVTDMYGNRIGFGRATGRHFAKLVSQIICLIGFIMAAFTEKRQGLHDMIAGTLVLEGAPATGGFGVTLDQPPPPPPSDFGGYRG